MTVQTPRDSGLSGRTIARLVAGAVGLVLLLVFVFENGRTVPVRFLFWETDTRLAWALLIAGLLGVLLGLALPRLRRLL